MTAPLVFISHRHSDRAIGEALAQFLNRRSSGGVRVHLSSSPGFEGPRLGRPLNEELKRALGASDLVVLIYTSETEDWSYCMWECGVATDPNDEKPTKVVVFQCGRQVPKPYDEYLRVDARNGDSILEFVKAFFTSLDLFHTCDQPLTTFHPNGEEVRELATELHGKLADVLPAPGADELEERAATTYLCVEFDAQAVQDIKEARDKNDPGLAEIVRDRSHVVDKRGARALFSFHIDENTTIGKLVEEQTNDPMASPFWFESLVDQLGTVVCGRYPLVKWAPYAVEPGRATIPFVAGCRAGPAGGIRLHVYFIPMSPRPVPVVERMIRLESMFHKNLAETPGETITLAALLNEMKADNRSRVPMLGEGGRPRFMVHRSMIVEFLSARALDGDDVTKLTVHDLLLYSDQPEMFAGTFGVVDQRADIDEALLAMNAIPNCQDVFVTADGTADGAVLGWLTNSMFIDPA